MRGVMLLGATALVLAGCGEQALDLPADPIEKAATCGVVTAVDAREKSKTIQGSLPLDAQGKIVHYAMLAGAESDRFEPSKAAAVVKRMPELEKPVTGSKWKDAVGACDQAFPATVASGPIDLPKDPLDAELGCAGVADFIGRGIQTTDEAAVKQITAYNDMRAKLDDSIAVKLRARGQSAAEAQQEARYKAMATMIKLGPPIRVLDACVKTYG
ncbi:hypothetical protein [Sphingomonas sanxanigenens]|nr:hypothetical protein [Sphingomonas sanxanigenens]